MEFIFFVFLLLIGAVFVVVGVFAALKVVQMLFPNALKGGEASRITSWFKESIVPRFVLVVLLTVCMVVPLGSLQDVVRERAERHNEVLQGIAATWGGRQIISGPLLVIPFTERHRQVNVVRDKDGEPKEVVKETDVDKHFVVLPETLDMQFSVQDEIRQRGIYQSLVYQSDIGMTGDFEIPNLMDQSKFIHEIHFDQAYLAISLSDIQAINRIDDLQWGGNRAIRFDSGLKLNINAIGNSAVGLTVAGRSSKVEYAMKDAMTGSSSTGNASGFHAKLGGIAAGQHYPFVVKLNVNGSYGLRFVPFGRQTTVDMTSTWPHPSFQGSVLPKAHDIQADAFTASWEIPSIARNYPQLFILEDTSVQLGELMAGVDLVEPVNLYSKVIRAVKYGLLFIGLTFLTFLIFEIGTTDRKHNGSRLHIIQYALIGGALGLFYLLLLSLSEHKAFFSSYLAAASMIISIIVLYTLAAARSLMRAGIVGLMLVALYTVLYALLNLEDYALLMGTGLLLVVMLVLMFITRNINKQSNTAIAQQGTQTPTV